MRKNIELRTPDGHIIYGTLDSGDNRTLLIFVHGLTGSQSEHHYFNAAPFFLKKGLDMFRFNFYARQARARPLTESSIATHVRDLQVVIDSFKDRYQDLVLIGHSVGCLVILNSDLSAVSKIVLWDPATGFRSIEEKNGEYDADLDKYILHWGKDIIVGKQMIEDWMSADPDELVRKITVPCKFIFAGNHHNHGLWKPYLDKVRVKHESVVVDGATHGFVEEGAEQELFEETLEWIV
jgi:pimeloyl-ACP methyl ester carboxylesterase